MDEEIKPSQPTAESTTTDGEEPATSPAPQMKGKITFVPATAEDYARGFSFGTTFGTPYKDHPTIRSRM
jgi:hypothetical protein